MECCPVRLPRLSLWAGLLAAFLLITAIPAPAQSVSNTPRRSVIALEEGAIAYIPRALANRPVPVLVLLHGAGGAPREIIDRFRAAAQADGMVLLAPRSAGRTWDLILAATAARDDRGGGTGNNFSLSGGDMARIEAALERLRRRVEVDPARIALAGFSDGASYALSVGPTRPELYSAILAFSPGFALRPASARGHQPVFVTHGRNDHVLNFERSRAAVLPRLTAAGHPVVYLPFDGAHTITDASIAAALRFLADPSGAQVP